MRDLRHILSVALLAVGLLGAGVAFAQDTNLDKLEVPPRVTLPIDVPIDVPVRPTSVKPVPEPASMALFAVGAWITAYVLTRARRRR
jgi:hypothetical protein